MPHTPHTAAFDSTYAIVKDGYNFIWNRCRRLNTDVFATRVLGMKTLCIHGRDAAELFYDQTRLARHTALPRRIVTSLFGKGAIHTLDGAAHERRKAAFLSIMSSAQIEKLMALMADHWRGAIRRWEDMPDVVLFDEVQKVLAGAVCEWAGVPIAQHELPQRARDLAMMVDSFGGIGLRLWSGKLARARAERWITELVKQVRRGQLQPSSDSALSVMSRHRERDGELLNAKLAAVELLNVLRPTVAVAWYIAFAALALHEHPECKTRLLSGDAQTGSEYADLFMQEVRRYYPFTPYLGARVRKPFTWHGHEFTPGTLVLLDVHGTNHDPQIWQDPEQFRPERFKHWNGDAFNFIPQGGGPRVEGHRCPGEWITMHSIALALHFLTRCMTYEVLPGQDLRFDLSRMPTHPRSGFIIRDVRATPALEAGTPGLPSWFAASDASTAEQRGEVGAQVLQA